MTFACSDFLYPLNLPLPYGWDTTRVGFMGFTQLLRKDDDDGVNWHLSPDEYVNVVV